jgi:hypothetical protein
LEIRSADEALPDGKQRPKRPLKSPVFRLYPQVTGALSPAVFW